MVTPSFKTTTVKQTQYYGEFALEPLERGYGHTLGNSLRRVLLSSLKGAAITQVKISSVKHQFSTLDGLKEDIVELILNLKQTKINYTGDKPETLTLNVSGPKEITAKDIKTPATVKIVNPDQKIASLAGKKAKLKIKITVEQGMGYSPAESRKSAILGVIPVDAAFSPVSRVAYSVEETRVGRRTDFDKLIIKIWTDGTLKPKDALENSASILMDFFKQIFKPVISKQKKSPQMAKPAGMDGEVYDLTVEELELPTRIANALRRGGFKTVRHITQASSEDMSKVKNLGDKSIKKVFLALKKKGVEVKGE